MLLYENAQLFDGITDANRGNYPFILKGFIEINNGELSQINGFYKDADQLAKSLEKMTDNHDESLENLFFR